MAAGPPAGGCDLGARTPRSSGCSLKGHRTQEAGSSRLARTKPIGIGATLLASLVHLIQAWPCSTTQLRNHNTAAKHCLHSGWLMGGANR